MGFSFVEKKFKEFEVDVVMGGGDGGWRQVWCVGVVMGRCEGKWSCDGFWFAKKKFKEFEVDTVMGGGGDGWWRVWVCWLWFNGVFYNGWVNWYESKIILIR